MNELYHYTKSICVDEILQKGLIPGYRYGPYGNQPDIESIWLDKNLFPKSERSVGWAVIKVDVNQLDRSKLKQTDFQEWFRYYGSIPASAITLVRRA